MGGNGVTVAMKSQVQILKSLTSMPDAERLVDTLVESGEGKGRMIILTRMMIDN